MSLKVAIAILVVDVCALIGIAIALVHAGLTLYRLFAGHPLGTILACLEAALGFVLASFAVVLLEWAKLFDFSRSPGLFRHIRKTIAYLGGRLILGSGLLMWSYVHYHQPSEVSAGLILFAVCIFCVFWSFWLSFSQCPSCVSGVSASSVDDMQTSDDVAHRISLRLAIFTDGLSSQRDSTCSICLDAFSDGVLVAHLPCGHLLHKACAEVWISTRFVPNDETFRLCPMRCLPTEKHIEVVVDAEGCEIVSV
eukprot:TRINITY_DN2033_c0_g1_i1.p1 TRINITY_DN2033_c0_g1~~TRINITY_DN2033_c0_g1_i1.p1  ORF type:complete len:252 (-),score=15.91 TRINITY_DN2033_c0_g1_i1:364-1119(-)